MNPAAVRSAAARIAGRVHHTPVHTSATLDGRTGAQVLVKDEAVQKTGSFKARGALNRLLTLPEEARERGLVCVTAGNHGAAVAWAAAQVGAKATVVMPTYSPAAKVAACWSYGAEVVLHGDTTTEAFAECERLQAERGLTFVHPFDDPEIVAGQGTVGLELVEDVGPVDVWVVSVGGGGLLAGIVAGLKRNGLSDVPVIAVETEGAASLHESLKANKRITLPAITSIATSLGARQVAQHVFDLPKRHPIESVLVSDADAVAACLKFADAQRILVEPACGAALAVADVHAGLLARFDNPLIEVCGGIGVSLEKLRLWKEKFL